MQYAIFGQKCYQLARIIRPKMPKMTGCVENGPCWGYQRFPSTLAEHGRHIYTFYIRCLQECARAKRETEKLDICEPVKLSTRMHYVIVPPA